MFNCSTYCLCPIRIATHGSTSLLNETFELNRIATLRAKINKFLLIRALLCRINVNQLTRNFILAYNLSRKNELQNFVNQKRVKVDVEMVREYLNVITSFIAGNSNPAVVTLAAVIFNYKIVCK